MGIRKAQVGVEFMFALGMVFFIFLIIFAFVVGRTSDLNKAEDEGGKDDTCLLVSSLITSAFVGGDGMIINVSIEHNITINFTDTITNYKGLLVEGRYCSLAVHNLPNARLKKGIIRIENRNNYIDVENV